MPDRKVIQDSDEEDHGEESPVRQCKQAVTTPSASPNGLDISSSPQQKQPQPSAGSSTASTELLHREIHNAHISLLECSTSSLAPPSMPSSTSSAITKLQSTTVLDEERSKKPKTTYGGRKGPGEASFNFNSDDEDPIGPAKRARRATGTGCYQGDEYRGGTRDCITMSTSGNSIKTRRSNTDPSSIPQPIEHKTKRQQEAMTVDGSIFPSASRSSGATQQDVGSSAASRCPTTERASTSPIPPAADSEFSGVHISSSEKNQLAHSGPSHSMTSSAASSKLRKRAVSMLTPPTILLGEEIAPSSSAPASSPVKGARMDAGGEADQISKLHGHPDHGHDELSLSVTSSPNATRKLISAGSNVSSTRKKRRYEPELDDLVPDLPPEQYQPRPSRSRSALTADDVVVPADFSKRPESLAKSKKKSKRQKTAASQESEQPTRKSPKRRQAQVKPRAPEQPTGNESLGEQIGNDSTPALEDTSTLQPDTVSSTELFPSKPPTPKKTRGRPKKDLIAGQDVNPPALGPLPARENDSQEPSKDTKPASAPTPAKRGRKRKKAPVEGLSSAIIHNDDPASDREPEDPGLPSKTVLTETDPNAQPLRDISPKLEKSMGLNTAPLIHASNDVTSPAKDQTGTKKVLASGKDTVGKYRVGLSKRQSIPSLLRVVRK
ncbi:MAG: hypothetical protein Q9223_002522 [Gallowayella weberi]